MIRFSPPINVFKSSSVDMMKDKEMGE
jgi:hypothetical protein